MHCNIVISMSRFSLFDFVLMWIGENDRQHQW